MARTHYQVLGVVVTATAAEIKSAHRQLVLKHHPDRSKDPRSPEIFLEVQAAYEVLSNPSLRVAYDLNLKEVPRAQSKVAAPPSPPRPQPRPQSEPPVASDIMRLSKIFAQGRQAEAIDLARAIIEREPRQPLPYAVLGDIARGRGDLNQAAKWYAYAVQFDPKNDTYQRRYEELLMGSQVVTTRTGVSMQASQLSTSALVAAILLALMLSVAAMFPRGPETDAIHAILAFFTGTFLGGALAIGWWIDRLSATLRSLGFIVFLSLLNLGLGLGIYLLFGLATKGFNRSLSGWFGAMLPAWALFGLLVLAGGQSSTLMVLTLVPGALALGGLCGWAIGDALR